MRPPDRRAPSSWPRPSHCDPRGPPPLPGSTRHAEPLLELARRTGFTGVVGASAGETAPVEFSRRMRGRASPSVAEDTRTIVPVLSSRVNELAGLIGGAGRTISLEPSGRRKATPPSAVRSTPILSPEAALLDRWTRRGWLDVLAALLPWQETARGSAGSCLRLLVHKPPSDQRRFTAVAAGAGAFANGRTSSTAVGALAADSSALVLCW